MVNLSISYGIAGSCTFVLLFRAIDGYSGFVAFLWILMPLILGNHEESPQKR